MVSFRRTLRECLLPAVSPGTGKVVEGVLGVLAQATVLEGVGSCVVAGNKQFVSIPISGTSSTCSDSTRVYVRGDPCLCR